MWGQHPTANWGLGGLDPATTPPPRVMFPTAGRNLGCKIPLQPQQGSWGGVGSSPERGSPQGEGQERRQPAQHQVEERAVAGELGAADGRQALHRHRRRGQGGGRWAQVRDPNIHPQPQGSTRGVIRGNLWVLVRSWSSPGWQRCPVGAGGESSDALLGHRRDFAAASPSELVAPGCFRSWWVLIGGFEAEL